MNRINERFYRLHSEAFHGVRQRPWPGFGRVVQSLFAAHLRAPFQNLDVLDVGCGNGRYARALLAPRSPSLPIARYVGVDASRPLLSIAEELWPKEARGVEAHFVEADFVEGELKTPAAEEEIFAHAFAHVAAFGVLHHVPSFALRRKLIGRMCEALRPGGLLAVSFWQFGPERVVPWLTYEASDADTRIDVDDLEEDDFLLTFGPRSANQAAYRFCHLTRPDEVNRLFADLDVDRVDTFRSDGASGDQNLYVVVRSRSC